MFDEKNIPYLPYELVDIIADFVDYEKYYKPHHNKRFKGVINDIENISEFMTYIIPNIAWQCWGPGCKYLGLNGNVSYLSHHLLEGYHNGMYQIYYDN
jgi:hypothetical protein